jgi:F-type H+-transporting ATPase subunit alpha
MDNNFDELLEKTKEIGYVGLIAYPLIYIKGLPSVKMSEIVLFESGERGMVISLSEEYAEVVLFSKESVAIGTRVVRTLKPYSFPISEEYFGKIIDPLGRPYEKGVEIKNIKESRYIDALPTKIDTRERVTESLLTGVSVVDLMVPLGKGQREMVLGDRKVGKTAFLLQALMTQAREGTVCIYAGIGKKKTEARLVESFMKEKGISDSVVSIFSFASDPLGLIYITPYCAMTLAEYYRDNGKNVLVILDDLTTHAKYFREMSLLNKKFPGRESYPGDVFYTHARLFERAGNYKFPEGPRSITCLGVAETVGGDISGYIQTNLMSITDGHIFFDIDVFEEGRRPAVNTFLSVTRVGRQTQNELRWGVSRELTTFFTLMEKTKRFSHFGGELNEGIKSTLDMGERVKAFFTQAMGITISLNVQIIFYALIWVGTMNKYDNKQIRTMVLQMEQKYMTDEQYKKIINDLVSSNKEFNNLLGMISSKAPTLLKGITPNENG